MGFEKICQLKDFSGGLRIACLQASCSNVPKKRGVYLVVREGVESVRFRKGSTGGWLKGCDPSVPLSVLEKSWDDNAKVLYIGKAGGSTQKTTIQDRLRAYMKFGLGKRYSHWGGRYIWQLDDAKELLVYWKETDTQEPCETEKYLLNAHVETFGRLPFANLKR